MRAEILVDAKRLAGGNRVGKKIPNQLLIEAGAVLEIAVLRRPSLRDDKLAVGQRLELLVPELRDLFHERVGTVSEECFVAGECIMLPVGLEQPCIAGFDPKPAHAAVDIE